MTLLHATILGLVEGLTEFIPVSSSAHLILVRSIFNIHSGNDLAIDAVLQMATILAVLVYFFPDLWQLFKSFVRLCLRQIVSDEDKRMIWAIILGTIPAVIIGLLLEHYMETVFRNTHLLVWTLILGSALMFWAERKGKQDKTITAKKGLILGFFQSLALVPGISRSGATISGGLLNGLTRSDATRFCFLLSFPIIFGSGLKEFVGVFKSGAFDLSLGGGFDTLGFPLGIGFVVAFIVGLLSIHFLITYLKNHKLTLFIWYRVVLAVAILAFL